MSGSKTLWLVLLFASIAGIVLVLSYKSKPDFPIRFEATTLCAGEEDKDIDNSNKLIRDFTVPLTEGCFGPIVHIPQAWHQFYFRPVGDSKQFWDAIWIVGDRKGQGPFFANDSSQFKFQQARFQGHGTLHFYTNDPVAAPSRGSVPQPFQPTLPKLTKVDIREDDPHYCDKSNAIKETGGMTGITSPVFLFSDTGTDNTITWASGFQGTVAVCFVVDERGSPADIYFIQTPPQHIAMNIVQEIRGWHFKAGMQHNHPVRIQEMRNFIFR